MIHVRPLAMGAIMGLLMLGMLHLMLTGQSEMGGTALAVFFWAHIALGGILLVATFLAARLSTRVHGWFAKLHRPTLSHFAMMIFSAALTAFLAHLLIHGGL